MEKGFVIFKPDIQAWLLLFYQVAFQYQSFDFIIRKYEIKFFGKLPDQPYLMIFLVRILEIGFNPVFKVPGFTYIDNRT